METVGLLRRLRSALALLVLGCCAAHAAEEAGSVPRSGFLGSPSVYERLRPVALRDGAIAERWFGRQMGTGYFASVLVDEVMLYPEPKPDARVSAETLQAVRGYLGERLRAAIAEVLPLADSAGPQVLRMQTAIAGVGAGGSAGGGQGLAALFGSRGVAPARVFVEVRFHDARTGELVGLALREVDGEPLPAGSAAVRLEHVRESLDRAAQDAAATLAMTLSARPGGR